MKTKLWVVMTLAFFIVSIGNATETPKMNVIQLENQKALVAFHSPFNAPLEVTLTNQTGEILYYKKSEGESEFKKVFNFKEFGDGEFSICVCYGTRSIKRDIEVADNEIQVNPAENLFEPYFRLKEDKLNVSFLNITGKNVVLSVYKNGLHVGSTSLGKKQAIQKCVDLSNLGKGNYEVVLTDWFRDHRCKIQI